MKKNSHKKFLIDLNFQFKIFFNRFIVFRIFFHPSNSEILSIEFKILKIKSTDIELVL